MPGQGLILALLLLVGAPLGESFIVNVLHLWHYGASSDSFVSAVGRDLVHNCMALGGVRNLFVSRERPWCCHSGLSPFLLAEGPGLVNGLNGCYPILLHLI